MSTPCPLFLQRDPRPPWTTIILCPEAKHSAECSTSAHSLTLPLTLPSRPNPDKGGIQMASSLHVLILTPLDLSPTSLSATKTRLSTFHSRTNVPRHHRLVVLIQCTAASPDGMGENLHKTDTNDHDPHSAPDGLNAFLAVQTLYAPTPTHPSLHPPPTKQLTEFSVSSPCPSLFPSSPSPPQQPSSQPSKPTSPP